MTDWVWGRSLTEPGRTHIRETLDGIPVVYLVEGTIAGFALCGAWLVADVEPEERRLTCTRCQELAAGIDRGDIEPPRWSPH